MLKYFLGVIIRESFLEKDEEKFTKLSKNLNIISFLLKNCVLIIINVIVLASQQKIIYHPIVVMSPVTIILLGSLLWRYSLAQSGIESLPKIESKYQSSRYFQIFKYVLTNF